MRIAARHPNAEITLISPDPTFFFTPRLIDLLRKGVEQKQSFEIDLQSHAAKHGYRFLEDVAVSIDRQNKTIQFKQTIPFSYDVLVVASGARSFTSQIPGAQRFTFPIKTPSDVEHLHHRIRAQIDKAKKSTHEEEQKLLLSISAIGAGAAGVESICAVQDFCIHELHKQAPELLPLLSLTLIQGSPQILPGFSEKIVQRVAQRLAKRKIRVLTGLPVTTITDVSVVIDPSHSLASSISIWTAGIEPASVPITPETLRDRSGGYEVTPTLQIDDSIFAAGDVISYHEKNVTIPKNAQTAMNMSRTIADNICHMMKGHSLEPFHYVPKGNIIDLGGVGYLEIGPFVIETRFANTLRNLFYRARQRQLAG